MASPIPTNVFLGAGDGMARLYKWFHGKKKFNFIRWLKDVVKGLGGNTPVVQIEIVRESDFKKVHISFKYLFNT